MKGSLFDIPPDRNNWFVALIYLIRSAILLALVLLVGPDVLDSI